VTFPEAVPAGLASDLSEKGGGGGDNGTVNKTLWEGVTEKRGKQHFNKEIRRKHCMATT